MNSQPQPMEIYNYYITIRQEGLILDDAVSAIEPLIDHLTDEARENLITMLKTWETSHGKAMQAPAKQGVLPPTPTVKKLPEPAESAPAQQPTEVRQLKCPKCGKPVRKEDAYCSSCGEFLRVVKATTRNLSDLAINSPMLPKSSYFGASCMMLLYIRGVEAPISVNLEREVIIGRTAPDSSMHPDVDLTPYNAEDLGVSRLHISMKRLENTVTVTDLNSKNGTHVNGQKLHPHEVRVLRHGDEIRIGRLVMKALFKHQIKRL
jgi:hypothetical protein